MAVVDVAPGDMVSAITDLGPLLEAYWELLEFYREKERAGEISKAYHSTGSNKTNPDAIFIPSSLLIWTYAPNQYRGALDSLSELGFGDGRVLKLAERVFDVKEKHGY